MRKNNEHHQLEEARKQIEEGKRRNKELEKSLDQSREDSRQLRIELKSATKQISRKTVGERAFAIVLAIFFAFFGWGIFTMGIPVAWRIAFCIGAWLCTVWILHSFLEWLQGYGLVRIALLCLFSTALWGVLLYGYFYNAWIVEKADATDGTLIPIPVKASELPAPGVVAIQIGEHGATFVTDSPGSQPGPFKLLADMGVTLKAGDEGPLLSATIKDWTGTVVAEIDDNVWHVVPNRYLDKNYDANSLEIKDNSGHVIFQVRLFRNRVQLQGESHDQFGAGKRLITTTDHSNVEFWDSVEKWKQMQDWIPPMFQYPSSKHWREMVK